MNAYPGSVDWLIFSHVFLLRVRALQRKEALNAVSLYCETGLLSIAGASHGLYV